MLHKLMLIIKGFLMGIADVIPGVSGGTMALILGIYERLVQSISNIDLKFVRFIFKIDFYKKAVASIKTSEPVSDNDIDVRAFGLVFLIFLVFGIMLAALTGVRVIPYFMTNYPSQTSGLFFGLILASIPVPYKMMKKRGVLEFVFIILFGVGTYMLVGMNISNSRYARGTITIKKEAGYNKKIIIPASTRFFTRKHKGTLKLEIAFTPEKDVYIASGLKEVTIPVIATRAGFDCNLKPNELVVMSPKIAGVATIIQDKPFSGGVNPSLWFVFFAGAIAICAMILPGISGAFILLLLGMYGYVVGTVHSIVYGGNFSKLTVLIVFISGIIIGILAFSRVLNFLLKRYHSLTMAALSGLMIGSLRKIWPFQHITKFGYENHLPAQWDNVVSITLITFLAGFVIVTTMNYFGNKNENQG